MRPMNVMLPLVALVLSAGVAGAGGPESDRRGTDSVGVAVELPHTLPPVVPEPRPSAFPLPEHTARYDVFRRGSKVGELNLELRADGNGGYHFSADTRATALLFRILGVAASEEGRFAWENGGILPRHYSQKISRPGRDRFWHADFDWNTMQAEGKSHNGELRVPLRPETLDPLTLRLQLAARLADDGGIARERYEFRVLERDEVEDQAFVHRGDERLSLPLGCVDTARMERERDDDGDRNYYAWHAEAFEWMPVRIRQLRGGEEELDLQLAATSIALGDLDCD